jgi:hypothetical protein
MEVEIKRLLEDTPADRTTVQADVRVGTTAQAVQFAIDVARSELGVSADQAREAIRRYGGGQSNDAREDI